MFSSIDLRLHVSMVTSFCSIAVRILDESYSKRKQTSYGTRENNKENCYDRLRRHLEKLNMEEYLRCRYDALIRMNHDLTMAFLPIERTHVVEHYQPRHVKNEHR
jgi:predicted ATP-binding protein involved in virulence